MCTFCTTLLYFFPTFVFFFFFFNDTPTTEIYTLSLHDALPIFDRPAHATEPDQGPQGRTRRCMTDRRSEEHTSELQSPDHLVCRLLLEKKKKKSTLNIVQTVSRPEIQPVLHKTYHQNKHQRYQT